MLQDEQNLQFLREKHRITYGKRPQLLTDAGFHPPVIRDRSGEFWFIGIGLAIFFGVLFTAIVLS